MLIKNLFSFIVFVFLLEPGLNCLVNAQPDSVKSTAYINHILSKFGLKQSICTFSVRDSIGTEFISYQSSTLITPASNLKLISSVGFLSALGVDFSYTTKIFGNGVLQDSIFKGDLLFIGSGDPSIGGELYNNDKWYVFDALIDQLQDLGIYSVDGKVIGNDALFDEEPYPPHWSYDDLSFYYATELSALSFNRNCVDLTVYAKGDIGNIPLIEWFPMNTDYVTFINEQRITSKNSSYQEYYNRLFGSNYILLRSTLPQNYKEEESLSITIPALYFADTFTKYAKKRGFNINGQPTAERSDWGISEMNELKLIAYHRSKPLSQMIQRVNKNSDNFYTEMLTKTISNKIYGIQGTTQAGIQIIKEQLAQMDADTTQLSMTDASGMAFSNLITTQFITDVLVKSRNKTWFTVFENSLSIAGIDGTLQYRLSGTELQGNFKGKSGYISNSRTLSGYLRTKKGTLLTVSFAVNHFIGKVKPIDQAHEQILQYLYTNY